MTTTVKLQRSLQTQLTLDITGLLKLGQTLLGRVEAVDVGLVVLGVVQRHDLFRDGRLERL